MKASWGRLVLLLVLLATVHSSFLARHRALLKAHRDRGGALQAEAIREATQSATGRDAEQEALEEGGDIIEVKRSPLLPRDSLSKMTMFQVAGISRELSDSSIESTEESSEDFSRFRALRQSMSLGQPPGPKEYTRAVQFKYKEAVTNKRDTLLATAADNDPEQLLFELRKNAEALNQHFLKDREMLSLLEEAEVEEVLYLEDGRAGSDGVINLRQDLEEVRKLYPYLRTRLTLLFAKAYRAKTVALEVRMINNWNDMSQDAFELCFQEAARGGVNMGDHIFNRGLANDKFLVRFADVLPDGEELTLGKQLGKFFTITAHPVFNCPLDEEDKCSKAPYSLDYNKVYFGGLVDDRENGQPLKLIKDLLNNGLTKDQARHCLGLYLELVVANSIDITAYHRVVHWPNKLLLPKPEDMSVERHEAVLSALRSVPDLFDKMCDAIPELVERWLAALGYND